MVDVAHDPVSSAKLAQIQSQALLYRSESIQCVEQLCLAFSRRHSREQVVRKEQVLSCLIKAILPDLLRIDIFKLQANLRLGLHTVRKDGKELHLVLCEIGRSLRMVTFQKF